MMDMYPLVLLGLIALILLAVSVRNADSVPSCRVRESLSRVTAVFSVDKEYER